MAEDIITTVTEGYAFDEPAVGVGALVVDDDKAVPDAKVAIPLAMFNRHGLVAGATGTGKTVTLQVLAEQLAQAGVPVFLADIKGDLSGMATNGDGGEKLLKRTAALGQDWSPQAFPVEFYALGGQGEGTPLRATMTAFGPTLLSKVLDLNDTQESSLGLIFHYADAQGLPLLDLKDLRAVVQHLISDEGKAELKALGGLSAQTAGVILRALINFADQGADRFFGEPEFNPADLLTTSPDGRGTVSILELPDLQAQPALFSTFLMWLLAELFQDLPEVGDLDKPKLVFFFDEAHLLFNGSSKAFLTAITQTVRLIRSKGVGVFFVTQTPKDVPADVLAQLGARVQHALRAFTPQDAKALKATVTTFPHSAYDLEEDLTRLGIGEAMVTVLDDKGRPTPVAWTRMYAPRSRMGPSDEATMSGLINASAMKAKYGTDIDRDSAYEILARKVAAAAAAAVPEPATTAPAPPTPQYEPIPSLDPSPKSRAAKKSKAAKQPASSPTGFLDTLAKSAATTFGREITRTLFGTAKRR
ncbi:helicase HerA-like domain-containing protein [Phytomonospora endophytica]|uniref:Helicase HerA-like C-terminal domain-containing protein n=1 Tax=Phytomonospora endophytica TaxID=714109 RepID=A0A841FSQ1_9ACTN|nr:helicase HerA-like domain-containing protein [Phytomonospora endophytica]MBB6038834.1 hypothetical protein [Phytomonospora endophytica]GIG68371.1 ATPase [Phytomonospora endophytica]